MMLTKDTTVPTLRVSSHGCKAPGCINETAQRIWYVQKPQVCSDSFSYSNHSIT